MAQRPHGPAPACARPRPHARAPTTPAPAPAWLSARTPRTRAGTPPAPHGAGVRASPTRPPAQRAAWHTVSSNEQCTTVPMIHAPGTGPQKRLSSETPRLSPST